MIITLRKQHGELLRINYNKIESYERTYDNKCTRLIAENETHHLSDTPEEIDSILREIYVFVKGHPYASKSQQLQTENTDNSGNVEESNGQASV